MLNSMPIIRLELEWMRHTLNVALSEYSAKMDEDLKNAVNNFCTAENLKKIIYSEAEKILEGIIRQEVDRFFRQDPDGKKMVAYAVKECILKKNTFTPLDDI